MHGNERNATGTVVCHQVASGKICKKIIYIWDTFSRVVLSYNKTKYILRKKTANM